jgi:4-hydroxyphenylacetate 3-hydroxylase N terminal
MAIHDTVVLPQSWRSGTEPLTGALLMLMTGKDYLQSIRDGRVIYVGKERVKDQPTHPGFAGGAHTYAALFDMKSDPALRDIMTFEEGGERFSMYKRCRRRWAIGAPMLASRLQTQSRLWGHRMTRFAIIDRADMNTERAPYDAA